MFGTVSPSTFMGDSSCFCLTKKLVEHMAWEESKALHLCKAQEPHENMHSKLPLVVPHSLLDHHHRIDVHLTLGQSDPLEFPT